MAAQMRANCPVRHLAARPSKAPWPSLGPHSARGGVPGAGGVPVWSCKWRGGALPPLAQRRQRLAAEVATLSGLHAGSTARRRSPPTCAMPGSAWPPGPARASTGRGIGRNGLAVTTQAPPTGPVTCCSCPGGLLGPLARVGRWPARHLLRRRRRPGQPARRRPGGQRAR